MTDLKEANNTLKTYIIPEDVYKKYNTETCFQIIFTHEGLKRLKEKYHAVRGVPGFLHNLMKGRPVRERDVFIYHPFGFMWTPDRSAITMPNLYVNLSDFNRSPRQLKDAAEGLALVAWVVHPQLLTNYGWEHDAQINHNESFKNFLHNNHAQMVPLNYKPLERRVSQEKISDLEFSTNIPYLASILDLTPSDLPFLKMLRERNRTYLINNFGVDMEKDKVEMFFHFPYPESTVTLHLHVRVNQGRHPFEKYRSFSLDEIIEWFEQQKDITDLIFKKPYYSNNVDILRDVEGITLIKTKNPYMINSRIVDTHSREVSY